MQSYFIAGGVPTRHTHKWDGLHTRHLLESTHTTHTNTNKHTARPDKVRWQPTRGYNTLISKSRQNQLGRTIRSLAMERLKQDVARRRQTERGSCEPDGDTSEVGFHPGLGGSFGSLSSLRCDDIDDNVNKVDDADTTHHAVWTEEALSMWKGHHAEALSRRPTREAVCPDGVARHLTGMPGDSGVERHEAHQAWR
jgi:hypothetical protein